MIERYVLIANPTAGHGRGLRLARAVQDRLKRGGRSAAIEVSKEPGDVERIAAVALADQHNGDERVCIVPCGGDGSVQEATNAILQSPASGRGVLGLAPGGRCNDFATAFDISRDPDMIAGVLLSERVRRVDVGRINDRYYCTIAALGFDAVVSRYVNDTWLPFSGTPAYVLGTLRILLTFKPLRVDLTFDDQCFQGEIFLAASANTAAYGGRMRIAPDADVSDGLLDVCIVSKLSRRRGVQLLRAVMSGRHRDLPAVRFVRTRTLQVKTVEPQEIWADGEYVTTTPATITAVPAALDVIVP